MVLLADLPLDVLHSVFMYLDVGDVVGAPIGQVCRLLRQASRHPDYLARISSLAVSAVADGSQPTTVALPVFAGILGRCRGLVHLSAQGCHDWCMPVIAGCDRVRHLDLSGCPSLTDRGIALVMHGCRNVESLVLRGCRLLTDASIEHVTDACRSTLRRLDISETRVTHAGLSYLAQMRIPVVIADNCVFVMSPLGLPGDDVWRPDLLPSPRQPYAA
ncbi:F-box domain-containing protein [Plasmodiophora brassicae]